VNGQGTTPAGWYADPAGRHQQRYWNGVGWTDDVVDNGVAGREPLTAQPPATQAVPGYGYAQAGGYGGAAPGQAFAQTGGYAGTAMGYGAVATAGAAPATVAGGRSAVRLVGGLLGVVGGAAVIVATFLEWFSGYWVNLSGWDVYDLRSEYDQNVLVVGDFFGENSPLFSGLVTLIVGVVIVLLALLLLALPGSKRAGARELNAGVAFLFVALASLLLIPGIVNLVSWLASDAREAADAAFGFYLVLIGGAVAWVGVLIAAIGKRRPAY
jgi:hypothetical protein